MESEYHQAFRRRLREMREAIGYTQVQMATALDMPLVNYKQYEVRSKFPLHKLERLALVTHETLDYIITGHHRRAPHLRVIRR